MFKKIHILEDTWVTLPKTGQYCDRNGKKIKLYYFERKSVQNVEKDVNFKKKSCLNQQVPQKLVLGGVM